MKKYFINTFFVILGLQLSAVAYTQLSPAPILLYPKTIFIIGIMLFLYGQYNNIEYEKIRIKKK